MMNNHTIDACSGDTILWMENYTEGMEFLVNSMPSYMLRDPEDQKIGPFVTLVYCINPLDPDCASHCLESIYSDSEEEAEKKHNQTFDKWNYIQYSNLTEVTHEEVQDWRFSDLFGI